MQSRNPNRIPPAAVALIVLLSLSACALGWAQEPAVPVPAPAAVSPAVAAARALGQAFTEVARTVTPAVVNISSTRVEKAAGASMSPLFRRFFPEFGDMFVDPQREVHSLGSGVIVRPDGYIATNCHVVQDAQEITVALYDNREFPATLVGQDTFTDLAVIKIDADDLPLARFGDASKLQVGEWVIAIGSPLGLAQTVTAGIVSAVGRKNLGIQGYEDFIQTDAAINPGNSGGALVNLDGKLVGINTAIASEGGGYDGVCFAIPSTLVWPVVDALIRDGTIKRPWIGILPRSVDRRSEQECGLEHGEGILIANLIRNSPAHVAGLRPGDVLLKWHDRALTRPSDLAESFQKDAIGSEVEVVLARGTRRYKAKVTVTERPTSIPLKGLL